MSTTAPPSPLVNLDSEGLDRGIGFLGLLWASETSIIGSGWLFGALGAAALAGPSAILGWVLGSVIILVLALVHAELGGLFPVSGGTSRFPHYAFGSFAGATFGWASYLQAASVAPIEVLATIQYTSGASWAHFAHGWYKPAAAGPGTLSGVGIVVALALLVFFIGLNLVGIRLLARVNAGITTWKIAIPVVTILIFLIGYFHSGNFGHGVGGFFNSHGGAVKNILETLPAGIIFSLLGFEQATQLGGEARDPKDLPKAIILSIIIGGAVYILVQLAFLGGVPTNILKSAGGWSGLVSTSKAPHVAAIVGSPFYTVASVLGLSWFATILSIDAIISPGGTGLIYETASARISFGLSRNGFIPEAFERVTGSTRTPVVGIVVAAIVGALFLLPFPSWAVLVNVVTSMSVLMYAGAPVSLAALRKQKPDLHRPYRLPGAWFFAPAAFVGATWVIMFSGWETMTTVAAAMLVGYLLIALNYALKLNSKAPAMDWVAAPWIVTYLIGMLVLSYLGPFGPGGAFGGLTSILPQGGTGDFSLYASLIINAAFALVIFYWAVATRLPESKVDHYVVDVYPPPLEAH
jgi:amino acid transporter